MGKKGDHMNEDIKPEVRRMPIILSEHAIALLTLFRKPHDCLDDLWAFDWLHQEVHDSHRKSAKQFIDAMDGHWCPAFLMSLRDQIDLTLAEHDREYGTNCANRAKKS